MVIGRHEQIALIFVRWIAGRRLCGGRQSLEIEFVCVPLAMHFCHYILVVVVPAFEIKTKKIINSFRWTFHARPIAISFQSSAIQFAKLMDYYFVSFVPLIRPIELIKWIDRIRSTAIDNQRVYFGFAIVLSCFACETKTIRNLIINNYLNARLSLS